MRSFSLEFQDFYSRFIHTPSKTNKNFAVVFSSSQLLDSGLGEKIDSFDRVMRFNFAPTIGFEKDVGAKTTHRIMQPSVRFREKNEECLTYENYDFPSVKFHLRDAKLWQQEKYQEFYEHFHIISHHIKIPFSNFMSNELKTNYKNFSVDLWGLVYAVACSKKPTLFGWENWKEREKSTRDHYFDAIQVTRERGFFIEESRKTILFNLFGKKKSEDNVQKPNLALEEKIILKMQQLNLITIHGID